MDEQSASEVWFRGPEKELIESLFNEDNINLERQFLDNQRKLTVVNLELREAIEEITDISNTNKSSHNEFDNFRMFVRAGRAKLDTENSMIELLSRERQKLAMVIDEQCKNNQNVQEVIQRTEGMLHASLRKFYSLMRENGDNEERLNDWLEKFGEEEEDVMCYDNFMRLDQIKIRGLLLKVSQLNAIMTEKNKRYNDETIETKALKFSLNKVMEETMHLHAERNSAIRRLHQFAEQLQGKQAGIELVEKMSRDVQGEIDEKQEQRLEKEALLEAQKETNVKMLGTIEEVNESRLNIKREIRVMESGILELKGELKVVRSTLNRTSLELELQRVEITHAKEVILKLVDRLKSIAREICLLTRQRGQLDSNRRAIEEEANKSVEIMKKDLLLRQGSQIELGELQNVDYMNSKRASELATDRLSLATQMELVKKGYDKVTEDLEKIDKFGLLKLKFLFIKELTVQITTRQLKIMEGHMLYVEQAAYMEQIRVKTAVKDECVNATVFWSSQSREVKAGLHRTKNSWEKSMTMKVDISRRYANLVLQIETCNLVKQEIDEQRKNALIDELLFRANVNKMRMILMRRVGEVLTIEKVKEELESHMRSKKIEVDANKLQFKSRIQLAKEKNHRLLAEVADKKCKANQLVKKYEVLIAFAKSTSKPEGSITSFAMKSVVEKEELRQKGGQLDRSIKKAEMEIKAMKNAISVIRCSNQEKIMKGIDLNRELAEKVMLGSQLKKLSRDIDNRNKQIDDAIDDNNKKKAQMEVMTTAFQERNVLVQHTEDQWKISQNSLKKQQKQLHRAIRMFRRKLLKNRHQRHFKKILKDLEVTIMQLLNDRAMNGLMTLFEKFPTLKVTIEKKMVENEMKSPETLSQYSSRRTSLADLPRSVSTISMPHHASYTLPMIFLRKTLKVVQPRRGEQYKKETIKYPDTPAFKSPDMMIRQARKKASNIAPNIVEFFKEEPPQKPGFSKVVRRL